MREELRPIQEAQLQMQGNIQESQDDIQMYKDEIEKLQGSIFKLTKLPKEDDFNLLRGRMDQNEN